MSDFHGPNTYTICSVLEPAARVALNDGKKDDDTSVVSWKNSIHGIWVIAYVGHGVSGREEFVVLNRTTGTYLSSAESLHHGKVTGNLLPPRAKRVRWNIIPVRDGSGAYWITPAHNQSAPIGLDQSKTDNGTIIKTASANKTDKAYHFFLRAADESTLNCPVGPQ